MSGSPAGAPSSVAGVSDATARHIAAWLLACAAMVVAVLLVGGITRLTHSGLSIVQWQPLSGALPPLDDAAWKALFDQYRATPEFRLINAGMDLAGFRHIFWWEYAHRLLGRVAGLVFLVPLLGFALTRRIDARLTLRLALIFLLGGLQGALGWYMVSSGLVDDPQVSPLRLGAHLGLALLLIGALLWNAWALRYRSVARHPIPGSAMVAVALVFLMALSGGLVAGTRAGLAFNTFPLMDGALVPADLLRLDPWYDNLRYNLATIQFLHRALALLVLLAVLACWWRIERFAGDAPAARRAARRLLAALALQLGLGIATLLSGVALPLAALHQAGAVLLFGTALWTAFALGNAVPRYD